MKKILFFATYPIGEEIIDGMAQRIHAIDDEYSQWHRTYVEIGLKTYLRMKHELYADGQMQIYRINLFLHLFFLLRLIREHQYVYIHSLHNYFKLYLFNLNRHHVTLDIHGTVPEEMAFAGRRMFSEILSVAELKIFRETSRFVCVSEEMRDYYLEKYPSCASKQFVIKPIFSQNAFSEVSGEAVQTLRDDLGIRENDTIFIYSGNTQKWQNVELTLRCMNKHAREDAFHIILTGNPEGIMDMLKKLPASKTFRYVVRSVAPTELCRYYSLAHYGYILRDEHVLNRVAAPTKLIEYLYYGIIPIVKYERIGDSFRLGYEHISYKDDLSKLIPHKSKKNREIALMMSSQNTDNILSKY